MYHLSEKNSKELAQHIKNADAIVIGAGAGLSVSAGLTYDGERFEKNFSDFIVKYHFPNMYVGGFYPFSSLEEHWAYWSRFILINRYQDIPKTVYSDLLNLVKKKDYFILTTNVDHCFQRTGFDKTRLFYTQGDYGLWQCLKPCHKKTYDNKEIVYKMVAMQQNRQVPKELIPFCPICGRPMSMNLRSDNTFVQDEGWEKAYQSYANFLQQHKNQLILFLELGVGENTPGIIKYSFWKMVHKNPKAIYACINLENTFVPSEILTRSICIKEDIGQVLTILKERDGKNDT